jgi:EAL domain-containing protein (putative c-di-GMP-specific phosphodiesterase class I)/FixJ family two-component response regulator
LKAVQYVTPNLTGWIAMPEGNINASIESILVVDDSSVQRQHTVALVRQLGVELIYEAGNGHDALQLLGMLMLPPSLIIVDLEMPGMDGVELIQQLQERRIALPVIIASSREAALLDSVAAMVEALDMRVLGALSKPLSLDRLRPALAAFDAAPRASGTARPAAAEMTVDALTSAIGNGELQPFYQPKVDIQTGRLSGVEALARWHHPALGMIMPDRFIALAEQCGQIHALTMTIMEQAVAQGAQWNARGLPLKVAINLSPMSLLEPQFVRQICGVLDKHGMHPEQVVLEITESSVVANLGTALGGLARLRLKGFGLSIDDYGTGFSSMQQLARIPFTELKVDRSFVHGANQRRNLRVILQSALDMAGRLELVSVAEGVETMEDWRLLQDYGCTTGQGYLIAKPMPAAELPQWLKTHQRRLTELRRPAAAKDAG